MKIQVCGTLILAISLFPLSRASFGQDTSSLTNAAPTNSPSALPPVTVTGQLNSKTDLAPDPGVNPATVVSKSGTEILKLPILSYGDIYRDLPGFDVANYGQGGLGYGISIRGWDDSEHGHDIATFIDGMPINEVSSLQVNGYTDLNPLIPELVKQVDVTYGPFNPRYGNFALAGSSSFTTVDSPATGVYLSGGSFDTARELAVYNLSDGKMDAYTALETSLTGGYRQNQNVQDINSFSKVSFPLFSGTASVQGQIFDSGWGSPGYLNRALVESGALSPTAAVDIYDGGSKTEQNTVFNYKQGTDENQFTVNSYFMHDYFVRYRDRDTSPVSPSNLSDQSAQTDNRMTFGGGAEKYLQFDLPHSMTADFMVGAGVRVDDVRADSYTTIERTPIATTFQESFYQYNPSIYAQSDFKPLNWIKLTLGGRFDDFAYDINDKTDGIYINPNVGGFSPKVGLTLNPVKGLTFFANYAYGIRSPDATSDLLTAPNASVARESTIETGVEYKDSTGRYSAHADVYQIFVTDELEDNDVTTPVNLGKSMRDGFDVNGRATVFKDETQAFTLVADGGMVRARLLDQPTYPAYIPNVPPWLVSCGFDYQLPVFGLNSPNVVAFSVRDQFTGAKKLTTDGSATTSQYSRVSAKLSYTRTDWHDFNAYVGVIIYPDNRLSEAAFELGGGVVGVSPQAPVSVTCGVSANF